MRCSHREWGSEAVLLRQVSVHGTVYLLLDVTRSSPPVLGHRPNFLPTSGRDGSNGGAQAQGSVHDREWKNCVHDERVGCVWAYARISRKVVAEKRGIHASRNRGAHGARAG